MQRVLVVDSKVEGLARIQAHLLPHSYAFTWAVSGAEALETLTHEVPDVAIIDGEITGPTAVELVSELRRGKGPPGLPILVVIERGDDDRRARARKAGADEVLEKPFEKDALAVCVRLLIRMKVLRDEVERGKREIIAAYEEQRDFIEALVHDFKNPISVVHVNLAWIADRIGTEDIDLFESISDAQEGILRVQKMVDDLLMVGMLEQSALPMRKEFIRLTDLLDTACKSNQKEADARRVSLRVTLREPIGVVGDPVLMGRIIHNMIESSLRHTPSAGKIEVSARIGDSVEIAISNNGRPLDAEEKAQLLDKSPPSSAHHRSSGSLGLYLCRRGVEAHSGEVDIVESAEWPTSVIMRFPATGS